MRFIVVGIGGLLLNLLITYVFTQYLGFWYLFSFCIAALITWTGQFLGNSFFTFRGHSKEQYAIRYLRFMGGYLGIFGVNASIVFVGTSILHIPYLFSIIIASGITLVLTFFWSSRYVYER